MRILGWFLGRHDDDAIAVGADDGHDESDLHLQHVGVEHHFFLASPIVLMPDGDFWHPWNIA